VSTNDDPGRRLEAALRLARRVEGDRLMLADAVLLAALDASRPLTATEQAALRASPLTQRRLRALVQGRSAQQAPCAWQGSGGMLRAASGGVLTALATDDGHWALHFVQHDGSWRVILTLDANAPFAARLVREQPLLRVRDGAGAIVLQGSLDADGECESAWPFAAPPGPHFQASGARFAVEPVRP